MLPPQNCRLSNSIFSGRHGKSPFQLLVKGVQETPPQITQALAIVLGSFQKRKDPAVEDTTHFEHGNWRNGSDQDLTWKAPH